MRLPTSFAETTSLIPQLLSMSRSARSKTNSNPLRDRQESSPTHRRRPLRALFVHLDEEVIDACRQELEAGQFTVQSDFTLNLEQCAEQVRLQPYDVMLVEYPSPACKEAQMLELIRQPVQEIPLIFVTAGIRTETIAALTAEGSIEYVEREHLSQLPLAVRRVLNERRLRSELEEAKKALRHSQSRYRALADNPTYGIYRCDAQGELMDVNLALVTMLGYASKAELLEANQVSEIIANLCSQAARTGAIAETRRIEPIELEWIRKDGTPLKARLSGRGIYDDHGNFAGHEIIAVDVTEQRTLESQLRHQASSDSMTGLANHGRLFEVLHSEICRSERTGREFSLLLLDLDGLKKINDQHGHLVGSRALCRLAQIVTDCSRSVDTAARHGGDEFALVLPETGAAAAALVGNRIRELLAKDGEAPELSVSVGVAAYPSDANTIGTLLYAADRALYEMKAKQPGAAQFGTDSQPLLLASTAEVLPNPD
jgi:diguanylate cyclase (GGDEF)-like protein/PAS domain S-box-containing protein